MSADGSNKQTNHRGALNALFSFCVSPLFPFVFSLCTLTTPLHSGFYGGGYPGYYGAPPVIVAPEYVEPGFVGAVPAGYYGGGFYGGGFRFVCDKFR